MSVPWADSRAIGFVRGQNKVARISAAQRECEDWTDERVQETLGGTYPYCPTFLKWIRLTLMA